MPAGPRIRSNSEFGLTTDNPLTAGATTFNSARLSLMPVVSAAHAVVTLDPRAVNGEPEIVIITAHTAAATVATISRGAYDTIARSHPVGTEWIHAPIDEDFIEILTSVTRPSDPYAGQPIFQTDTDSFFARNAANTAWANINMYADPPAVRAILAPSQTLVNGIATVVIFDAADTYDTDTMHNPAVLNTRIVINTPGIYAINFVGAITPGGHTFDFVEARIRINGTTQIAACSVDHDRSDVDVNLNTSVMYKFAAAQYYEVLAVQTNSASANKSLNLAVTTATWIGRG